MRHAGIHADRTLADRGIPLEGDRDAEEATFMIGPPADGSRAGSLAVRRWVQLILGIICMSMVANLQYGWTLFVNPLDAKYHWGGAAIQMAFSVFLLTETWLVPVEGYLVDRYGPKPVVMAGGILCGLSWTMNSVADSLPLLYAAAAVGGVGAGAVYGTCMASALKWFPDRAGLAAGLTAAGFGAGSALTVVPISSMIKSRGYEAAFLSFGIVQGLIVFMLSWFCAHRTSPRFPRRRKLLRSADATTAPGKCSERLRSGSCM